MFVYCRYIPKQLISELVSGAEYGWVFFLQIVQSETTKRQTADVLNNEILPDFLDFSNFLAQTDESVNLNQQTQPTGDW